MHTSHARTHARTHAHTHTHTYIHTYIHTYTHTYIHTYITKILVAYTNSSSQFRERFYHSYERNTFKLADEFLRQDGALSLHPLKTAWLMGAVHKRVDNGALMGLSQVLYA